EGGRERDPIGGRPEPAGDAAERSVWRRQPAVRQRLLDQDAAPRGVSLGQRGTGRGLHDVPRRLNGREERLAVDTFLDPPSERIGLVRTCGGESEEQA